MRLRTAVNQYITYRRSLGEGFVDNKIKLNAINNDFLGIKEL